MRNVMTPRELKRAGHKLFGTDRGWQARLARALETDRASITRYLAGQSPIPGPVAAAITCWLKTNCTPR